MLVFLSTPYAPTNDNESLENKPYFCLGLLSNLADLVRPVEVISIIFGVFDAFSTSQDETPLRVLDDCWAKRTFFQYDVCWTHSESGHSISLNTDALLLAGHSCTYGTDCVDVTFSGANFGSWLRVSLWYSSRYRVNQLPLSSILSFPPLYRLRWTRSVQFGGIVISLMNITMENSSSNTTWNWGDTWPVAWFRTRYTDN